MKLFLYIALIFTFISSIGCKPNSQENKRTEIKGSQPHHFKKTSDELPNFNQDVHVIRMLWQELSSMNPAADEDQNKKHALLLDALREKVRNFDPKGSDLTESDQTLLQEVNAFLRNSG